MPAPGKEKQKAEQRRGNRQELCSDLTLRCNHICVRVAKKDTDKKALKGEAARSPCAVRPGLSPLCQVE